MEYHKYIYELYANTQILCSHTNFEVKQTYSRNKFNKKVA